MSGVLRVAGSVARSAGPVVITLTGGLLVAAGLFDAATRCAKAVKQFRAEFSA